MTNQKYTYQGFDPEHMAKAMGRSMSISTKQSVEICRLVRNKNIQRAKTLLNNIIDKKEPLAFKRYGRAMGHKKGPVAAGRYPIKASKEILGLLEAAEANAQFKGLNTGNLVISHICAHKGGKQWHYGRQRGRRMKRTHVEVIVEEKVEKVKKKPVEVKKEEKIELKAEENKETAKSKKEQTKSKPLEKTEQQKGDQTKVQKTHKKKEQTKEAQEKAEPSKEESK